MRVLVIADRPGERGVKLDSRRGEGGWGGGFGFVFFCVGFGLVLCVGWLGVCGWGLLGGGGFFWCFVGGWGGFLWVGGGGGGGGGGCVLCFFGWGGGGVLGVFFCL